jgi:two-component system sensor histidine kinase KdpD
VLTAALAGLRGELSLPSDILLYLAWVVVVALVGGMYPALCAAIVGSLLLNYYFTPPIHEFTIAEHENVLALLVFLAVAVAVSITVDLAARRTREAAWARSEAEMLSTLSGSVLRGTRPLTAMLDQLREAFGFAGVSLLERRSDAPPGPEQRRDPNAWQVAAAVGDRCQAPSEGDVEIPVDDDLTLVLCGHPLAAADRRVVEAFAAQAAIALRQEQLAEQAAAVKPLADADRLRTALLSAVSHDLRTPLASAKAAITSLRSDDVVFDEDDRSELLAAADDSLDRLSRLVENLLDMSRLQAGVLGVTLRPISVDEAVAVAASDLGEAGRQVTVRLQDGIAQVRADPGLVERVLANLLSNALRHSPADRPPMVTASNHAGGIEIRVIDHGPGIPVPDRERVFLPFQRLGDRDNDTGAGLGLALSRGLTEAMGGSLEPETTPGGGLTMILRLPAVNVTPAASEESAQAAEFDALEQLVERHRTEPHHDPHPPPESATEPSL